MTQHQTNNNNNRRHHHHHVDLVDPVQVPFMGFIRNDQETMNIMAKAATIVPKACDILGISLSDSESEEEDTAEAREERSPQSHQKIKRINNDDSNNSVDDNQEVQEARPKPKFVNRARQQSPTNNPVQGELGSHVRKSRKRCASTPLGQSTSSALGVQEETTPNPPKKRRFPSISSTPDATTANTDVATAADNPWGNLSPEESAIRNKMFQDLEFLNQQLTLLAAVEKAKYRLMEKFMQISENLKKQREQGRQSPTLTLLQATNNIDDGTNDHVNTATATTTSNISIAAAADDDVDDNYNENGNSMDIENYGTRQEGEENDVIFTESDLNIGAEETVLLDQDEGEVRGQMSEEADDSVVGSLI